MRKFSIVVLALFLVMGLSAWGLAADTDSLNFSVTVAPYYEIEFDTPANYKGLFAQHEASFSEMIGKPGIYVSDGGVTRDFAIDVFWAPAIVSAQANGINSGVLNAPYFAEGQINDPMVELFKVDANTMVDVTLSADWSGWMNAPTILRVSSDEDEATINGYGDWDTELAVVGNTVNNVFNADYNDLLDDHNTALAGLNDTFTLDFAEELLCHGPIDFHLNGALWMPKASQVAAGEYSAEVTVTIAATNTGS
jgi:hypothetical protein